MCSPEYRAKTSQNNLRRDTIFYSQPPLGEANSLQYKGVVSDLGRNVVPIMGERSKINN
jgi:hypothetical protein